MTPQLQAKVFPCGTVGEGYMVVGDIVKEVNLIPM
jgi:hypothetical protein